MKRLIGCVALVVGLIAVGARATPILQLDFDDRTVQDAGPPPNTVAGFNQFLLPGTTASVTGSASNTYGSNVVTLAIFDSDAPPNDTNGAMDDRDRTVPSNSPPLAQLYDDFVFVGGSAGTTGGLDVSITGLTPSTQYTVSLYAYDDAAGTGTRTATWTDGFSNAFLFQTSFTQLTPPTTDDQYKFSAVTSTDATGKLLIKGRRHLTNVSGANSVYIDGLVIDDSVPEPTSAAALIMCATLVAGLRRRRSVRLTM